MVANGYPLAWIAGRLGDPSGGLRLDGTRVAASTARRVAELADRCAVTPGPSDSARAYAAARGWTPDLLWADLAEGAEPAGAGGGVDRVAVERACAGEPVALSRAEREQAAAALLAAGHGVTAVARRLRLSGATAARLVASVSAAGGAGGGGPGG
jgi:hypothetical protein